ncbi:hypothetical protein VTI74DRAFT_5802 [Chaetomium olivicolor]
MAPRKAKTPRAVSAKGKDYLLTPPKEPLTALPSVGKRKRDDDGSGADLPSPVKKANVPFNVFARMMDNARTNARARSNKQSSSTESGGSADPGEPIDGSEPMDVDPTSCDTCDGPTKKLKRGIDSTLAPISDVVEMFEDMIARLQPLVLKNAPLTLAVATICSGTDAPIFALCLIQAALQALGYGPGLEIRHVFSCEIEPFKQGFISRNMPPATVIFRDVVELSTSKDQATTAAGSKAPIPPEKLDILFAGCSCVDYSNLNHNKPSGRVPSLDRHLKQRPNKKRGKRNGVDDEDPPCPVKLVQKFVDDLDPGLDELLRLPFGGESARTFFAAVKLIARTRPKAVILENVLGAPWDMYTKQIFPKLEYVAEWVRLDSKEFYLPQTRQRGYLVAVDAMSIGEAIATAIASEWVAQISRCKRSPSAPISAYLRAPDDPTTVQARADMESKPATAVEWNLCSIRHAIVRQKYGLRRDENPVSKKAMRNGRIIFANFPSHSWMRFWEIQVPRIPDLVDIVFAIVHKKDVDLGYKTGMIDVSQNVDRTEYTRSGSSRFAEMKNLGIIGCITPSGLPVVTDLLRPVTGTEALALQGLPVDELVISTETQAQLRDLAGNAMTVTVVGAATLALILAVSVKHRDLFGKAETPQPNRGTYIDPPQDESLAIGRPDIIPANVHHLLTLSKRMVRVCHCPTRPSQILVCKDCGTTACPACRGNPEHNFHPDNSTNPDLSADKAKVLLKEALPHILRLPIPPSVVERGLRRVKAELYRSVVLDILTKDPVYYFDEIKFTEVVTVCYKAVHSIARLVLTPDSHCYWYIYVAPWHQDRTKLSAAFDLHQPVARGQSFEDLTIAQWSIWVLGQVDLTLQLNKAWLPTDTLVASDLSLVDGNEVEVDPSLLAWKNTVESKVCGSYAHYPRCGTPGQLLRIKEALATAGKIFMMWDSGGLRDPELDHFVWTDTARRLEPHEYRETFLHAKPSSLTWKVENDLGTVGVYWPGYWSSSEEYYTPKLSNEQPYLGSVQIHWGLTETLQQAGCHLDGQPPVSNMPLFAALAATFGDFPVAPARLSKIDAEQNGNRFHIIPATGCDAFLKLFAFVSSAVCLTRAPLVLHPFPHLQGRWVPVAPCHDCSVTPPEITVHTKEEIKKKTKDETKFTKVIIEDPDQAAQFERQYQDLPRALAVAARLFHHANGMSSLEMRLMLQPKTLASRALGYLRQAHRTATRGSAVLNLEGRTFFTVKLDYVPSPASNFAPFVGSVLPCGGAMTVGIDRSSRYVPPASESPRFRHLGTKGKDKGIWVDHKLRDSQKEAVKWMLRRELVPLDFIKCEIEEEVVSPLNMRVMGKAEWANHFPYSSRGGVVAHEIGYGKTVVTLALIDHQRKFDETHSIAERIKKVDSAWARELPNPFGYFDPKHQTLKPEAFFVHLSATLVIVPKHITEQWANEAYKFLGLDKPKLLVIKTTQWLFNSAKLEDFQQAEVIIISSAVFGEAFMDRLQPLSGRGTDYPRGLSGRSLETWYRRTLRNHRILTAYYLAGKEAGIIQSNLMSTIWEELLPRLVEKEQEELQALVKKQVPEIDRKFYKDLAAPKSSRRSGAPTASKTKQDGDREQQTANKATNKAATNSAKKVVRGKAVQKAEEKTTDESEPMTVEDSEENPAAEAEKTTTLRFGPAQWNINWFFSFSFARVVWDECSYNDEEKIPLVIANVVANSKWLLSGTPKLFDLAEVCNIAASFGVHVARPEPRMMPGLPPVTKGPVLEPMSKSEEFHVFSSRVKSVELAHERHKQAHKFVKEFFRANALDAELKIRVEDKVRLVAMKASTAVCYRLLEQEILDAGYDYTALPAHSRGAVALKGSDLVNRDGPAAAKMLQGMLACGLGERGGSVQELVSDLNKRSEALEHQMKFLWDKMMWLYRWMIELKPDNDPMFKLSEPIQDTLMRIQTLCRSFKTAIGGQSGFEDFGGLDMFRREAAVVSGV